MGDYYLNQQWEEESSAFERTDEKKRFSNKKEFFKFLNILRILVIPVIVFLVGNSFQKNMTSGIETLNMKMDLKFSGIEEKMDFKFKGMDLKFEKIDLKLENMGKQMGSKLEGLEKNVDLKIEGTEKDVHSKFKSMEKSLHAAVIGSEKRVNLRFQSMEHKNRSNDGFIDALRQCTITVMTKLGYPPEQYRKLIVKEQLYQKSQLHQDLRIMLKGADDIEPRRYKITVH